MINFKRRFYENGYNYAMPSRVIAYYGNFINCTMCRIKSGLRGELMSNYKKIQEMIEKERKAGAFVFMPSPILSMENSFYMPVVETIELREDEVYCAQKKYRIHYNGLLRLASAAGFEWSAIDTCRTDGRTDKLYCSFRAVGGVRKADGKIYFHKAEKDIDLEIIEMELEDQYSNTWITQPWPKKQYKTKEEYISAMVRRDMIQKRKNKLMLVESGAKARVIRFVLGLQSQYSNKNQVLGMPFVMVHYALNPNHPDVKKALTGSLTESQNMIYGGVKDTGQIAYIENDPDYASEVIDVGQENPNNNNHDFIPENEIDNFNGGPVDFKNSDIADQIKVLKLMCEKKGEDYSHYARALEKKGSPKIDEIDQAWRDNFFKYLNDIK